MTDYDELIRTALSVADGASETINGTRTEILSNPGTGTPLLLASISAQANAQTRLLAAILERLDTPTPRPGPCGATQTTIVGRDMYTTASCTCDHGHTGAHTDGTGVWHDVTDAPTAHTTIVTDPSPDLIAHGPNALTCLTPHPNYRYRLCHLNAGHAGDHMTGTHQWTAQFGPAPTDAERCTAERDGSRCVRNDGHKDAHFGAGAEWMDECGATWHWNPDTVCQQNAGHPGPHTAGGVRWGNGYCDMPHRVTGETHDRHCTLTDGHDGHHRNSGVWWNSDGEPLCGAQHPSRVYTCDREQNYTGLHRNETGGYWPRDTNGLKNLAAADIMTRRPIPGRIRYMAERLEGVIHAINEDRIGRGDLGVLGGIVIALAQIADDMETATAIPDESAPNAPVLPNIGEVVHYTAGIRPECHRSTVVDHVNGQLMLRVAHNDSVGHFTSLVAEDPWRGPNATTVGPHNDYTANTWHPTH